MVKNYRKQVVVPLYVYNLFNQLYFKYFENHGIRWSKKELDPRTDQYLANFISKYWTNKLSESKEKFERYLLWCFREYGKIPVILLHSHIDDWIDDTSNTLHPIAAKVSKYLSWSRLRRGRSRTRSRSKLEAVG